MKMSFRHLILQALTFLGFSIIRTREKEFLKYLRINRFIKDWNSVVPNPIVDFMFERITKSKAQLHQDLVALYISQLRPEKNLGRTPFFVEFGASDGKNLSNTFYLEKEHKWNGILVEPGKKWHDQLDSNRSCKIDHRCVFSSTGEFVAFLETDELELSTIASHASEDDHAVNRMSNNMYHVETVSLDDLLDYYNAPKIIDFISIDTEGSELEIIENFDFSKRTIIFFSIEHNFTVNERFIDKVMESNGYRRVFSISSKWDAWYVLKEYEDLVLLEP